MKTLSIDTLIGELAEKNFDFLEHHLASNKGSSMGENLNIALVRLVSEEHDTESVRWLIEHGADPNYQSNSTSVLEELVKYVDANTTAEIDLLVRNGLHAARFPESLIACVRSKVDVAMHTLSEDVNIQSVISQLLAAGVNPNFQDDDGNTCLHEAVRYYYSRIDFCPGFDLIPILLSHGASPTVSNNDGATPLDLATFNNDQRTIRQLQSAMHEI